MTVRELLKKLQAAKNQDMIVAVCDPEVPYREVIKTKDSTGTVADSETGIIDGVFLLFAEDNT